MTMIYMILLALFLMIVVAAVMIFGLYYRQDSMEHRLEEAEKEIQRNYELDNHQETQINIMRSKDE